MRQEQARRQASRIFINASVATAVASPLGLPALLWDHGPRRLVPDGIPPHTSWLNADSVHAATAALGEEYPRVVVALAAAQEDDHA